MNGSHLRQQSLVSRAARLAIFLKELLRDVDGLAKFNDDTSSKSAHGIKREREREREICRDEMSVIC